MDPYEKILADKQRKQKKRRHVICAILAVLILGAALAAFLALGGYRIDVHLSGDREVRLRYGETYQDPGAAASLKGPLLPEEGIPVEVFCEIPFDPSGLGEQTIKYNARVLFWHGYAVRKIMVTDKVRPRIILMEDPSEYVIPGETYREEGYYAADNYDGDLTDQVQITRYHNRIVYRVQDSSGNTAEAVRNIVFYDPVFPELTLAGSEVIELHVGETYQEPGYVASDNLDGDLTSRVAVTGKPDIFHAGIYTLTYSVTDSYGNTTRQIRKVKVASPTEQLIIEPEGKVIYLTFDDGPGPYTEQLLDVLAKYDVKVTFFVVKNKYSDILKEIVRQGHAIGIHSVCHDYKTIYASEEAYRDDLLEMQQIIESETGIHTTLVRFPGGSSNTVSKFNKGIMTRLSKLLGEMGFQYFDWNVNSGDAGQTTKTEEVVQFAIDGISRYDVAIVLQHDIKEYSVEAVEEIILWGLENGYRFLPLDPTSPNAHHKIRN